MREESDDLERDRAMLNRRRATVLKMFMVSLVSLGVLTGVYSADTLRPVIWAIWISFLFTATVFMFLVRLDRNANVKRRS